MLLKQALMTIVSQVQHSHAYRYADVVKKKLGRKVSAVIKTAVGAKGPTAVINTVLKQ